MLCSCHFKKRLHIFFLGLALLGKHFFNYLKSKANNDTAEWWNKMRICDIKHKSIFDASVYLRRARSCYISDSSGCWRSLRSIFNECEVGLALINAEQWVELKPLRRVIASKVNEFQQAEWSVMPSSLKMRPTSSEQKHISHQPKHTASFNKRLLCRKINLSGRLWYKYTHFSNHTLVLIHSNLQRLKKETKFY